MLLIDRKMPKSCSECICNDDDYRCNMTGDEFDYDIAWTGRMPNCPLKEAESKKGRWIEITDHETPIVCKCTECGWLTTHYDSFSFCPNCGSDMRGTPS